MAEDSKKGLEGCSQRALSALVFLLVILVLGALPLAYRRLTHGHGEVVAASQADAVPSDYRTKSVQSFLDPDQSLHGKVVADDGWVKTGQPDDLNMPAPSKADPEMIKEVLREAEQRSKEIRHGYGSVLKAYEKLKHLVAHEPFFQKNCKLPRFEVLGKCVCPAGTTWDSDEEMCLEDTGLMYFYMYRAQSEHNYPMSNVDMADLAGVLYYLHHEIVKTNSTPGVRMNGITRILRWLVAVRPSQEVRRQSLQFMPFVAFDSGRCSVPGCNRLWDHYGFAVGCQRMAQHGADAKYGYTAPNNPFGAWFSLPGPCPELRLGEKVGSFTCWLLRSGQT